MIETVCLIVAVVCFGAALAGWGRGIAAGLAFFAAAFLLPRLLG